MKKVFIGDKMRTNLWQSAGGMGIVYVVPRTCEKFESQDDDENE